MRKTFQLMIAAGALSLPMIATAGPDHEHDACPEDCASACCIDLAELVGFKAPTLIIGSDAPEMQISQFVKGESMDEFEEGKVYVVEFWATWCGPCIAAFPHISELQAHYGDKVQVVGVNIWDHKAEEESQGEWVQRISEFVDEQGDNMSYTVAIEEDKAMAENWMIAAGRNGIPSAFIVDGEGTVAWMGHPMGIDDTLESVVDGSFDMKTAKREAKLEQKKNRDEQLMQQAYQFSMKKISSEDEAVSAEGYVAARALAKQLLNDNAQMLNSLAWPILDPDSKFTNFDFDFALELGFRAAELTDFEDPMILDTYATALYKTGDVKKAIKIQKKAISLIKESEQFSNYLGEFEDRLEVFETEG